MQATRCARNVLPCVNDFVHMHMADDGTAHDGGDAILNDLWKEITYVDKGNALILVRGSTKDHSPDEGAYLLTTATAHGVTENTGLVGKTTMNDLFRIITASSITATNTTKKCVTLSFHVQRLPSDLAQACHHVLGERRSQRTFVYNG